MSLLTFIKCYSVFVVVTNIIMFGGLTVINIATVREHSNHFDLPVFFNMSKQSLARSLN